MDVARDRFNLLEWVSVLEQVVGTLAPSACSFAEQAEQHEMNMLELQTKVKEIQTEMDDLYGGLLWKLLSLTDRLEERFLKI